MRVIHNYSHSKGSPFQKAGSVEGRGGAALTLFWVVFGIFPQNRHILEIFVVVSKPSPKGLKTN